MGGDKMSYKEIKSFEQECRDKDAEIERLLLKHEKEKNTFLVALETATQTIQKRNQLITDLADALNHPNFPLFSDLRRRAREVIKIMTL